MDQGLKDEVRDDLNTFILNRDWHNDRAVPYRRGYMLQCCITLASLLNILDGVGAAEGRIVIMTSNCIEKLDSALIHPGRIDKVVPHG